MRKSESARMTTAQEAAFRVPYPNSTPRAIKVIALDSEAGKVIAELGAKQWNRAVFFSSLSFPSVSGGRAGDANSKDKLQAWLKDVAGHASELVAEIDSADIVVVVASPGTDASAASIIGNACRLRHKSMIGLILKTAGVSDERLSRTLMGMRPLATMLVVASGTDYVEEMLHAMRA
ncbi:MAG: hypothetical protein AB7G35_16420 [Hyphomicrobiaceae bacterium]